MFNDSYSPDERKKLNVVIIFFAYLFFVVLTATFYAPFLYKIFHSDFLWTIATAIIKVVKKGFVLKMLILAMSLAGIMTYTSEIPINRDKRILSGQLSIVGLIFYVFLMITEMFFNISAWFALPFHVIAFFLYFLGALNFRKRESEDLLTDRRNEQGLEFDQHRECVEWECSVNIPYKYWYLGQERLSWINIVNPFRGTLVGGTPGSGKSFAIIEEYMRQCIMKGFTGLIYDFKFPTLAKKTWNYLNWYKDNNYWLMAPAFCMVNFDDPEYSHRCNPISRERLKTVEDADEATKVLMLGINKTWVEKEGDFFTDSANVYASILCWYLKLVSDKYDFNMSSLPHLITLSTFESTELLFLIFQEYDDLKAKMRPFAEALANGALEQLAGQVSSAGIALAKISSPTLAYILSGNDFDFELNDPSAPKILVVGNNEARSQTYSPALGLVLTTTLKAVNREGYVLPSMFFVDEFPTVYFKGIDNLIATARSRKVNTLLGFQTFAQIKDNYGDKQADKIIKLCGTRITGQLFDDDSQKMSETIGKQKILTRSFTYSEQSVSEAQQTSMETIVPPERIAQLSQGTFCGVVADDIKYPEPNKVIYGAVQPYLDIKNEEEKLDIPKVREFISEEEKTNKMNEYFKENFDFIHEFIDMLMKKSFDEWNIIMSKHNSKESLDNYMIETFVFHRKKLQDFTAFISFKSSLKEMLNKEQSKMKKGKKTNEEIKEFLRKNYSQEEWVGVMKKWIKEGFKNATISKYMMNYQLDLQNDCYLLIAQELRDLKIFERAEPKKRKQYVSYLERLKNSTSFKRTCSEGTMKEYEKLILEVKEFIQQEEEEAKANSRR
jgi:putative mobilization protein traG family